MGTVVSGRRGGWAEQQRTAGEAKVGSESEEGETEHGSERDFGRVREPLSRRGRSVWLAPVQSLARRAHPGACSLARSGAAPPPPRHRQAAAAALAAVAADRADC